MASNLFWILVALSLIFGFTLGASTPAFTQSRLLRPRSDTFVHTPPVKTNSDEQKIHEERSSRTSRIPPDSIEDPQNLFESISIGDVAPGWEQLQRETMAASRASGELARSNLLKSIAADPDTRVEYGFGSDGTAEQQCEKQEEDENDVTLWDDQACSFFVVQGGLQVVGDLKLAGRLVVLSGMDVTALLAESSQQIRIRCSRGVVVDSRDTAVSASVADRPSSTITDGYGEGYIGQLRIDGTLVVPQADMYVAGVTEVGGSVISKDVVVNAGGQLFVGLKHIAAEMSRSVVNTDTFASQSRKGSRSAVVDINSQPGSLPLNVNSALDSFTCPVVGPYGSVLAPASKLAEFSRMPLTEALKLSADIRRRSACAAEGADAFNGDDTTTSGSQGSPSMPFGDIAAIGGRVIVDNAGIAVTFGNVQASAVVLNDAAALHALCGHVYTNTTDGAGITALDGSILTAGGVFESQSVSVVAQSSASLFFRGGIVAARHSQIDDSSFLYVGQSMLTPILAIDDQSVVVVERNLEVPALLEAIDSGRLLVLGNVTTGALQSFDGGDIRVGSSTIAESDEVSDVVDDPLGAAPKQQFRASNLFVRDFAVVDQSAYLSVERGNVFVNSSLHVSNSSEFSVTGGDLLVNGIMRVVSSVFAVDGSVIASESVLAGQNAQLFVGHNLISAGVTAAEAAANRNESSNAAAELESIGSGLNDEAASDGSARALNAVPRGLKRRLSSRVKDGTQTLDDFILSVRSLMEDESDDAKGDESDIERQETDGFGGATEVAEKSRAVPALYGETALFVVGNKVFARNSWIEFGRDSRLLVLNGARDAAAQAQGEDGDEIISSQSDSDSFGLVIENGVLILGGGSEANITTGGVTADVGISLDRSARLYAPQGFVQASYLDLQGRSEVVAKGVEVGEDAFIGGMSKLTITDNDSQVIVGGAVLTIDERSVLTAPAVIATKGDIFVEDGGLLKTTSVEGDVAARGFVVAQDRGRIESARSVISYNGDVVAENGGSILAPSGQIKAARGLVRATPEALLVADESIQEQEIKRYHQQPPAELVQHLAEARENNGFLNDGASDVEEGPEEEVPRTNTWERWAAAQYVDEPTEDEVYEYDSYPDDAKVRQQSVLRGADYDVADETTIDDVGNLLELGSLSVGDGIVGSSGDVDDASSLFFPPVNTATKFSKPSKLGGGTTSRPSLLSGLSSTAPVADEPPQSVSEIAKRFQKSAPAGGSVLWRGASLGGFGVSSEKANENQMAAHRDQHYGGVGEAHEPVGGGIWPSAVKAASGGGTEAHGADSSSKVEGGLAAWSKRGGVFGSYGGQANGGGRSKVGLGRRGSY